MNILKQKHVFFNRTFSFIPPQLRRLYTFGFHALACERVTRAEFLRVSEWQRLEDVVSSTRRRSSQAKFGRSATVQESNPSSRMRSHDDR